MKRQCLFVLSLLASSLFVSVPAWAGPASPEVDSSKSTHLQFVDLLWLKPGVDPASAGEYFNRQLPPILEKHGGRVLYVYRIDAAIRGELKPAITASLTFPSMQALQALFKDPDYQTIVPRRDAIFDFTQQSLWRVSPMY